MLDSIHLFLESDFENNKELVDHILLQFGEDAWIGKSKLTGQKYYAGKIRNLKIKLSVNSIAIEGSLSKFYFGNNQKTMLYDDIVDAIVQLENILRMKLENAIVRRIDLADNLLMESIPCSYYPLLIKGGFLKRREDDNGLYFRNNNRSILLYDKLVEQKKNKEPIESFLEGKNVLRYEFRMNRSKEIGKRLNLRQPLLTDVILNYELLVKLWSKSFDLISKEIDLEIPDDKFFNTPSLFKDYLAIQGIKQCGGFGNVINMIHEARARSAFKYPNQGTNLKRSVRDLVNRVSENKTPQMILELQNKIDRARDAALTSFCPF
ncbi:phage/plasmid replication domain-containing protein [Pedobacter sp. WC2501]|uniref:phage/plasmid replication domain-containing protein n=1 Tax=Pedobacter sp. WC2501 TaxID=3461400 RepID=UPI004045C72F